MAERRQMRDSRMDRVQSRVADRRELRGNRIERIQSRMAERQQMRIDRREQFQNRMAARQDFRAQRIDQRFEDRGFNPRYADNGGRGLVNGCPPGLAAKFNGCLPPGQAKKLIGAPLAAAASYGALNSFPQSVSYLYPDTQDYYYRYNDGYAYRVDRGSNLISALLPLLGGGYMPGQYLPANYMNSYVPDYYGFNSFYPDTEYGCTRSANGVVYEVDCDSGYIEDYVPLYAGGYGVGQMLPSAYDNVPYEYRDMYYDTADTGYYYAPGAIYQYDPQSSMITSVAALLTPGFGIGQPLPTGYGVYNVPYGYRDTYYDTQNDWYRYNNGGIYRVDPTTQLVTALVASILT
jgi:hypothetical protein